jgi:hypothetical protein
MKPVLPRQPGTRRARRLAGAPALPGPCPPFELELAWGRSQIEDPHPLPRNLLASSQQVTR